MSSLIPMAKGKSTYTVVYCILYTVLYSLQISDICLSRQNGGGNWANQQKLTAVRLSEKFAI